MIHAIRCDRTSFKTVTFTPGLNVIQADKGVDSTRGDTRNGVGKTTLIEILHFCLGGNAGGALAKPELRDWTFFLDLTLAGTQITASRTPSEPGFVRIVGAGEDWQLEMDDDVEGGKSVRVLAWTKLLGHLVFGLPSEEPADKSGYRPTFRSLISYFSRRTPDAFTQPFEHFRKQSEADKQVNNTFLLGLEWDHARRWQLLRDRGEALRHVKKTAAGGLLAEIMGSIKELRNERVLLERDVQRQREDLEAFQVRDDYRDLNSRARVRAIFKCFC